MYLVPEESMCRRRPPEVFFRGVVSGAAPRRFTMAFSQRTAFGGLLRDTQSAISQAEKKNVKSAYKKNGARLGLRSYEQERVRAALGSDGEFALR